MMEYFILTDVHTFFSNLCCVELFYIIKFAESNSPIYKNFQYKYWVVRIAYSQYPAKLWLAYQALHSSNQQMKSCSHHRCYLWCVSSYSGKIFTSFIFKEKANISLYVQIWCKINCNKRLTDSCEPYLYSEGENASKKIETLPVDYVRLALESSEEISLFEEALRRFNINFNAKGDDIDAVEDGSPPPKIKCIITPSEEQSSMVRRKPNKLKLKLLENRLVTPASSSSKISEVYDDAADDHN